MSSADWIALAGVIVSIVAFAVAGRAYQLQRRTQKTSDEQQLNDLIEKIQARLASLSPLGAAITPEIYAANNTALTGLQGLALEARKVTDHGGLQPDWFQSTVLAYAFTQVWDCASALDYWGRAVKIATTTQSRVRSLSARAEFRYNRGLDDDRDRAREDFTTALDELGRDPDGQGYDVATEQMASMLINQAGLELMIGDYAKAADLIISAFLKADSLGAPWRKKRALEMIGTLIGQQKIIPAPDLLRSLKAELQRQGAKSGKFPDGAAALLASLPN